MRLSEKKKDQLYKVVSDAFLDARIAIAKLNGVPKEVDTILFHAMIKSASDAINVFNSEQSAHECDATTAQ